jgi:methionyl-tRNA synthetase
MTTSASDAAGRKPFYVTTAILYANAAPHVGHTFELIGADALARAKRLLGYDVFFQTGTDEHGQKMLEYAERAGKEPKAYADEVAPRHRELWDALHISYDRFIRTTDPDHYAAVEAFWKASAANGDIYKSKYEGWYCVTDENFVLESQVLSAPADPEKKICPECHGELTWKSEESYFFRWSKYQDFIEQYLRENPQFIEPTFRGREMVNSFLKPGLQDISISRTSIKWGIPVPGDPDHVIYVWFDALINYITGVGYGTDQARFDRFWPADMHIVGKDILKFHTLLWPAMCKSAGIEPPRHVFGHGFVSPRVSAAAVGEPAGPAQLRDTIRWVQQTGAVDVFENDAPLGTVKTEATEAAAVSQAIIEALGDKVVRLAKMSKSRGNIVDPVEVTARYGGNPDPLRFFLLKEIDFGGDGIYSDEALAASYTADLADKFGNLLSRTLTMVEKYQDGVVRRPAAYEANDEAARAAVMALFAAIDEKPAPDCAEALPAEATAGGECKAPYTVYEQMIDECRFSEVLEKTVQGAQRLNLYITETQPFRLAKDPEQKERLGAILYTLVEGLRVLAVQLSPFVPGTAQKIWQQVGGEGELSAVSFVELRKWGYLDGAKVTRGETLFPKE